MYYKQLPASVIDCHNGNTTYEKSKTLINILLENYSIELSVTVLQQRIITII